MTRSETSWWGSQIQAKAALREGVAGVEAKVQRHVTHVWHFEMIHVEIDGLD